MKRTIGLGSEKVLTAEQKGPKIAVEIQRFLGLSKISEFYGILGQFIALVEWGVLNKGIVLAFNLTNLEQYKDFVVQ